MRMLSSKPWEVAIRDGSKLRNVLQFLSIYKRITIPASSPRWRSQPWALIHWVDVSEMTLIEATWWPCDVAHSFDFDWSNGTYQYLFHQTEGVMISAGLNVRDSLFACSMLFLALMLDGQGVPMNVNLTQKIQQTRLVDTEWYWNIY